MRFSSRMASRWWGRDGVNVAANAYLADMGRFRWRRAGRAARRMLPVAGGATLMVALLAVVPDAYAQDPQVPYTVQIAALSDAETAIDLSGNLLRDGFPGYVVRAEGAAGSVYRVRVAAFGDRMSAERYAGQIGDRYDGMPQPALAEAIPGGILPLAPTRVARVEANEEAVLLSWGDDVALRVGPEEGPGRYVLVSDGTSFEALWAAPEGDGRIEVIRFALDGGQGSAEDDPAVRDALFRQRVVLLTDANDLDADAVVADAVRGAPGERFLVAMRGVAADGSVGAVRGVLRRDASLDQRSPEAWIGAHPSVEVEAVWDLDASRPDGFRLLLEEDAVPADAGVAGSEGEDGTRVGDGASAVTGRVDGVAWSASVDGVWVRLRVDGSEWRALVGTPLAGLRALLLVAVDGGFDVVELVPR